MEMTLSNPPRQSTISQTGDTQLLSKLSQEIHTPMNDIIGLTDQLLDSDLEVAQREHTLDIKRASNALLALINDVQDYVRIETGELELNCDWFSMAELLDSLSSIFRLMAQSKGISLEASFGADLPEVFWGDGFRLRQILNSLLGNALAVTQTGQITLEAGWDGQAVRFSVADQGPQAQDEDQARLFDPLVQLDAQKYGGAGSGLSLITSRSLCRLMGGSMVAQAESAGNVITATIPLRPGRSEDLKARLSKPHKFSTRSVRALVVDDIEINLFITRQVLESFNAHVTTVNGGREAVERVLADSFDIVFMDHLMPDMDGLEATRRIRQSEGRQSRVPIVALTANAVVGAREMFLRHGMDDYMAKPIEYEDMAACLLKWLPGEKILRNSL